MSRLGLIIQREYLQTVGKKSFILTTLLVPILSILLCVVAPIMLSSVRSNDEKVVAVIDQSLGQTYAPLIKDVDEFHFVTIAPQEAEDAHAVYVAGDQDYYALVVIPASIDSTLEFSIYSESSVPRSFSREI